MYTVSQEKKESCSMAAGQDSCWNNWSLKKLVTFSIWTEELWAEDIKESEELLVVCQSHKDRLPQTY